MKPAWLRILPLAAIAAVGYSGVASSQTMRPHVRDLRRWLVSLHARIEG